MGSLVINFLFSCAAQLNSDFHFTFDPLTHFTPQSGAQQVQCQQIAIEDDAILEDTEYFQVQLIPPVGVARVQVGVVEARVGITDDDTVQIGFTETDIVVDEDGSEEDRRVQVCVELLGQIDRAVSVVVTSQSVTADGKCELRHFVITCTAFSSSLLAPPPSGFSSRLRCCL